MVEVLNHGHLTQHDGLSNIRLMPTAGPLGTGSGSEEAQSISCSRSSSARHDPGIREKTHSQCLQICDCSKLGRLEIASEDSCPQRGSTNVHRTNCKGILEHIIWVIVLSDLKTAICGSPMRHARPTRSPPLERREGGVPAFRGPRNKV